MKSLRDCSTFFFTLAHFKGSLNNAEDYKLSLDLKSNEKIIVKNKKTSKQTQLK